MFPACSTSLGVGVAPAGLTFASEVTVLGTAPESSAVRESSSLCPPALPDSVPVDLPDIQIHEPVYALFPEEDPMDVSTAISKLDFPLLPAPPGFDHFVWPGAIPGPGGNPSTFDLSTDLPGWFPLGLPGATGDPPSLPVSPIPSDSQEVSVVGVLSASPMVSDPHSGTNRMLDALLASPPFDLSRPTPTSSAATVASAGVPDCPASRDLRGSPGPVPRWCLAREDPFLSERSSSTLNCFGDGCSFRHTTYRSSDYTRPSGVFWRWARGCGSTLCLGNRLLMRPANFTGMFA